MVDDISKTGTLLDSLRTKENADTGTTTKSEPKRNDVVKKEEFLNILVTQLKNQDPLNPMENDRFAVDLAQFSQLEQLINLNEKFDKPGGGDASSMAQYLGHDVAFKGSSIQLGDENADSIDVVLNAPGQVNLDVLDSEGKVVESVSLGYQEAGRHTFDLNGKTPFSGQYSFKVTTASAGGSDVEAESYILGQVTGFILGPDGKLLVGEREVNVGDVALVKKTTAPSSENG
jgi:flagellar basal-body rod modification protein FlgD